MLRLRANARGSVTTFSLCLAVLAILQQPGVTTIAQERQPAEKVLRSSAYLSSIENAQETNKHLNGLKDDYFELFVEDVISFNDKEIEIVVPELIKLLKNEKPLPGGPKTSDHFRKRTYHRADHALSLVAGVSLVNHFAAGGYPPVKISTADLEKTWRNWWKSQKGKTRKQWLEDRRPTYKRQMKNALSSPTYRDYDVAKNALYLMVALNDKPAAKDLLVTLKVELAKLKIRAGEFHGHRTDLLRSIVHVIGELGNAKMVPELVTMAQICNRPEIAYETNILRAFATTLNKLTGKNPDTWEVKRFEHVSFATSREGVRTDVDALIIKESAFAIWLERDKK